MIAKAELHCHLEGSIPPALARELARRNGIDLPPGLMGQDGFYVWKDFLSFLAAYDLVCQTLRSARDFGDVLYSYLAGAAREGAVYVEMFCSPERPAALGIAYGAWLEALAAAIDRARRGAITSATRVMTTIAISAIQAKDQPATSQRKVATADATTPLIRVPTITTTTYLGETRRQSPTFAYAATPHPNPLPARGERGHYPFTSSCETITRTTDFLPHT